MGGLESMAALLRTGQRASGPRHHHVVEDCLGPEIGSSWKHREIAQFALVRRSTCIACIISCHITQHNIMYQNVR